MFIFQGIGAEEKGGSGFGYEVAYSVGSTSKEDKIPQSYKEKEEDWAQYMVIFL